MARIGPMPAFSGGPKEPSAPPVAGSSGWKTLLLVSLVPTRIASCSPPNALKMPAGAALADAGASVMLQLTAPLLVSTEWTRPSWVVKYKCDPSLSGTTGFRACEGKARLSGFHAGGPAGHGPPAAERASACTSPELSTAKIPSVATVGGATPVVPVPVAYFHFSLPVASNGRPIPETPAEAVAGDRKSTRLNSSHQLMSYSVFCLKK